MPLELIGAAPPQWEICGPSVVSWQPHCVLIGWDFLQYAHLHAPCKLLLDLLLPVHRDGGRGMDSMRDNVRPQRVSEGRPGHLRQGLVGARHVHCGGGVMLGDVLLGHGTV